MFKFKYLFFIFQPLYLEPATTAAIIGAGANMLGGMMGNASSAKEARKNRQFQYFMSNTAHVRQVRDLKRAGLNPMLSIMGGGMHGASTPAGATAHQQNPLEGVGDLIASAIPKGVQVQNTVANTAKQAAEAEKAEADTNLANAQTAETVARTPTHQAHIELNKAQTDEIRIRLPNILEQHRLTIAQTNKVYHEISQLNKQGNLTLAQTSEALARAGLTQAQIGEVQPRINELIARTANLNEETRVKNLVGNFADIANIPKQLSNSASSTSDPNKLFQMLYDFFNPSSSAKAARDPRNNSPAYNRKHFPNYKGN